MSHSRLSAAVRMSTVRMSTVRMSTGTTPRTLGPGRPFPPFNRLPVRRSW